MERTDIAILLNIKRPWSRSLRPRPNDLAWYESHLIVWKKGARVLSVASKPRLQEWQHDRTQLKPPARMTSTPHKHTMQQCGCQSDERLRVRRKVSGSGGIRQCALP